MNLAVVPAPGATMATMATTGKPPLLIADRGLGRGRKALVVCGPQRKIRALPQGLPSKIRHPEVSLAHVRRRSHAVFLAIARYKALNICLVSCWFNTLAGFFCVDSGKCLWSRIWFRCVRPQSWGSPEPAVYSRRLSIRSVAPLSGTAAHHRPHASSRRSRLRPRGAAVVQ